MVSQRSTKGASKARRDHINYEIRNMRALLPISREDQERLSYLHSMAAICTYIRKSVLFQGLPVSEGNSRSPPCEVFLQSLHGFVLVTTTVGKLVYVSENVDQYLGISMVDVLQGDSLYDLVERSDLAVVKSNLDLQSNASTERSFVCCMRTSKALRQQHLGSCGSMMVRGRFQYFPQPCRHSSLHPLPDQPLFVALCTPTVDQVPSCHSHLCQSFSSIHMLDMTFIQLSDRVLYVLGYAVEEMAGRSWYSLIHPEDLFSSAESHRRLLQADEGFRVEMVLRLQCKDLSWTWVYIQASKDSGCQSFSCTNFLISNAEVQYLQNKISSDACRPSSPAASCNFSTQSSSSSSSIVSAGSSRRKRTASGQSEEATGGSGESEWDFTTSSCGEVSLSALGDSLTLFTPPYSPAFSSSSSSHSSSSSSSSFSPLQQEELSCELLMDVRSYADGLLSSPESSPPHYYSHLESPLPCHHSTGDTLHPLPLLADQTFQHVALGAHSPPPPSSSPQSPTFDFQASDTRLVPDCLPDFGDAPVDCGLHQDDFSFLSQPQEGRAAPERQVPLQVLPGVPSPGQSPSPSDAGRYSERERAEISILAQQISSLARSFSAYHPDVAPGWPTLAQRPQSKAELVLDDGIFDSILKDLDLVSAKGGTREQETPPLLPTASRDVMEALGLQLEGQDGGLHQLDFYTQSDLQPGGLAEETFY